jgi:hypothetical protein
VEEKNNKKKTGIIAGLLAVIVIAVVVVAVFIFKGNKSVNADQKAEKAFEKMAVEMKDYSTSILQDVGVTQLAKLSKEKVFHTNLDLSITLPGETTLGNISLELDGLSDAGNNKAETSVSVGAYGISLSLGDLIYSDDTLYLKSKFIFKDNVYSINLENFAEDFNNSAWSDLLGVTIPKEYLENSESDKIKSIAELGEIYSKYSELLKDSASYSIIKEAREFENGGNTMKCTGVEMTVDKDALNSAYDELVNDFMENNFSEVIFSLRYEEDLVLDLYMDKNGRIVNISTPKDIKVTSQSQDVNLEAVAIDINFIGTERALDEINGGIYIKADDSISYLSLERNAEVTDELYREDIELSIENDSSEDKVTVSCTNEWNKDDKSFNIELGVDTEEDTIDFYADGKFMDIVQGEQFTLKVNNAKVTVNGEDMAIICSTLEVEPVEKTIEVPTDSTDLLQMGEAEIENMLYGAFSSLY